MAIVPLSALGTPRFEAALKEAEVRLSLPMMVSLAPRKKIPVASLEQAAAACRAYITEMGLGSSKWSGGKVMRGKEHIATVSYNGRVWAPKRWEPGDKPIL